MSKSKTLWVVVGILIVVVAVVYVVAGRKAAEKNVIKIGWVGPLTGDAAAYGEPMQKVTELAVSEINAMGGIDGKQIQVVYEDGKCDGLDGANAVQKLVNVDSVQAILGGFCSSETLAGVPIATAAKVLMLSAGASSPSLTNISPYFFRDYPSDAAQGKVLADAAWNMKHWKEVAFIQEQTDYAKGVYDAFATEFQSLGGKVINQPFSSNTNDFRSILTTLRSQHPNALFVDVQAPLEATRILTQVQQLGWKPSLLIPDSVAGDPPTIRENQAILEGALTAEFGTDPTNSKFEHLVSSYQAKYGAVPSYESYAQTFYDAVYLLKDGINAVGNNGTALAQWSRTIKDWQGSSGSVTILPTGDRASGHRLEVIHGGKAVPAAQ